MGRSKVEISMCGIADLIQYAYQQYEYVKSMFDFKYSSQAPAYTTYYRYLRDTLKKYGVLSETLEVSEEIGKYMVDHLLKDYFMGNGEEYLQGIEEKSLKKDAALTELHQKVAFLALEQRSMEQVASARIEEYKKKYGEENKKGCPQEEVRAYFDECMAQLDKELKEEYDGINMEYYIKICTEQYKEKFVEEFLKEKDTKYSEQCKKNIKNHHEISAEQCIEICVKEFKKEFEEIYQKKCPEEYSEKFYHECMKIRGNKSKELSIDEIEHRINAYVEKYKKIFPEEYKKGFLEEKAAKYSLQCRNKCKEEYRKTYTELSIKKCVEICAEEYKEEYEETFDKKCPKRNVEKYFNKCLEICEKEYHEILASHGSYDGQENVEYHIPIISEEGWTDQLTEQIIDRTMLRSIFNIFYTFREEEFRKDLRRRAKCIDPHSYGEFLPGYYELTRKLENPLGNYIFMNKNINE